MTTTATVTPERVLAVMNGFWATQILSTAAHYSFFTHLSQGHRTADAVARAAGVDPRGARVLLDALVAIDLLTKRGNEYELTPTADAFLVDGRPGNLAPAAAGIPQIVWEQWGQLRDVVKSGTHMRKSHDDTQSAAFFAGLIRAIVPMSAGAADATAEHLGAGRTRTNTRVLDVGAGNAVWSIPFARRDAGSRITAFDFPRVLEETKQIVREAGVADRYRFEPGDMVRAQFGDSAYDVAFLGNICHGLTADQNRDLLKRLYAALAPGGELVIADMLPNEERTGPPLPVLFAVNMFLMEGTDTYTYAQYESWLKQAGFSSVRAYDTHRSHSPVIIGKR